MTGGTGSIGIHIVPPAPWFMVYWGALCLMGCIIAYFILRRRPLWTAVGGDASPPENGASLTR